MLLHVTGHVERIIVGITRHTDHEVELCCPQGFRGLLNRTHLSK